MIHLFFHDLKPPKIRTNHNLDFVLRVAFGQGPFEIPPRVSGAAAWRYATQLGLTDAFAERVHEQPGVGHWGSRVLREMATAYQQVTKNREMVAALLAKLETLVTQSSMDAVALDAPFLVSRTTVQRAQPNPDLLLLVASEDQPAATKTLVRAGFSSGLCQYSRVNKLVFQWPGGGSVLLDTELRFVRMVPGGVFVDVPCLKRCGQLVPRAVSNGRGLWSPSESIRAASLTAQALVEYRFAPGYSALSAIRAAISFGLTDNEDLAFDAYLLLQTDIEYAEFMAWRELGHALALGELSGLSKRARTLLDHAIAGATVPSYQLKLRALGRAQRWQHDGNLERIAQDVGNWVARIKRRT